MQIQLWLNKCDFFCSKLNFLGFMSDEEWGNNESVGKNKQNDLFIESCDCIASPEDHELARRKSPFWPITCQIASNRLNENIWSRQASKVSLDKLKFLSLHRATMTRFCYWILINSPCPELATSHRGSSLLVRHLSLGEHADFPHLWLC